jgi:hypothetical protein
MLGTAPMSRVSIQHAELVEVLFRVMLCHVACRPSLDQKALQLVYDCAPVRYMVIETYVHGAGPVYERAAARGRMLPPGLTYIESWIDARGLDRCFQLMETDNPSDFDLWIAQWRDLVSFEIVPVIDSAEAASRAQH